MQIMIVSPPRSGNHWVKCLLGTIYALRSIGGRQKPDTTTPKAVRAWTEAGGFPDRSILHLHCRFTSRLCDVLEALPAHIVTVVRDPYDVFVSRYYWTQRRTPLDRVKAERRPRQRMVGKSLDDPEVLAFLADPKGFGSHLIAANEWLHSGRAIVVRYEELHDEPVEVLRRVTSQIAPVDLERIEAAIAACQAETMRQRPNMTWNVRVATVGDSRQRLTEAHLAVFRERYADLIRSLGYEVR